MTVTRRIAGRRRAQNTRVMGPRDVEYAMPEPQSRVVARARRRRRARDRASSSSSSSST